MKEFTLTRRGISNPYSWMIPLAFGSPATMGLFFFGAGTRNEIFFWRAASIVVFAMCIIPILACFIRRSVRLNELEYAECQSVLGWNLWIERYSIQFVDSMSIKGLVWDDDREMYQLTLNLTDGRTLPSFVFQSKDTANRTIAEMNDVISHAHAKLKNATEL